MGLHRLRKYEHGFESPLLLIDEELSPPTAEQLLSALDGTIHKENTSFLKGKAKYNEMGHLIFNLLWFTDYLGRSAGLDRVLDATSGEPFSSGVDEFRGPEELPFEEKLEDAGETVPQLKLSWALDVWNSLLHTGERNTEAGFYRWLTMPPTWVTHDRSVKEANASGCDIDRPTLPLDDEDAL